MPRTPYIKEDKSTLHAAQKGAEPLGSCTHSSSNTPPPQHTHTLTASRWPVAVCVDSWIASRYSRIRNACRAQACVCLFVGLQDSALPLFETVFCRCSRPYGHVLRQQLGRTPGRGCHWPRSGRYRQPEQQSGACNTVAVCSRASACSTVGCMQQGRCMQQNACTPLVMSCSPQPGRACGCCCAVSAGGCQLEWLSYEVCEPCFLWWR